MLYTLNNVKYTFICSKLCLVLFLHVFFTSAILVVFKCINCFPLKHLLQLFITGLEYTYPIRYIVILTQRTPMAIDAKVGNWPRKQLPFHLSWSADYSIVAPTWLMSTLVLVLPSIPWPSWWSPPIWLSLSGSHKM